MKRVLSSVQDYWRNLGTARLPLAILLGALLVLIVILTILLLSRPSSQQSSAKLVASIVVPVERITTAAKPKLSPEEIIQANGAALSAAPDPALLEDNPVGPLPKRDASGRTPWQTYARPYDASSNIPMVGIIIMDMGLNSASTEQTLHDMPPNVTLAFNPYAPRLSNWTDKARQFGFETLLDLPMEPDAYPQNDPGPQTLLTTLSEQDNLKRLYWTLSRVSGPVGVLNIGGSKFTATEAALRPVLNDLNTRGIVFIDDATNASSSSATLIATELKMPFARASLMIDQVPSRDAIQAQFAKLIEQAKTNGAAIGVLSPTPLALEQIKKFTETLSDQNVSLAPVSAIVQKLSAPSQTAPAAPAAIPAKTSAPAVVTPQALSPSVAPTFVAPKLPAPSDTSAIAPAKAAPSTDTSSIAPQQKPATPDAITPAAAPPSDQSSISAPQSTNEVPAQNSITGH